MTENAVQFGGCFTINWHDRSIAPDRLWKEFYRGLIEDLKSRGAWFATAGQAVSWFRKRRSVVFDSDCGGPDAVHAKVAGDHGDGLPGLRLRKYKARQLRGVGAYGPEEYVDVAFGESIGTWDQCEVGR